MERAEGTQQRKGVLFLVLVQFLLFPVPAAPVVSSACLCRFPIIFCPNCFLKHVVSRGPYSPDLGLAITYSSSQVMHTPVPSSLYQFHLPISHLPQFTWSLKVLPVALTRQPLRTTGQRQCCWDKEQDSICIPTHHLTTPVSQIMASICPVTLVQLWLGNPANASTMQWATTHVVK